METPVSRLSALLCLLLILVAACKKDPDPVAAKSSAKALSSFTFGSLSPAVTATVSGNSVMATVPFGTNVTALAPTISLSDKATVSPASGVAHNFSNSVNYTVTAEDGSTQVYTVAVGVGVAPKSPAKDITAFAFNGITPTVNCTIDATTKVISGTLPASADLTKLIPTLTLSPKATVTPATGVTQDFSKEVVYTVTAEDASTVVYKVNVKKEAVVVAATLDDMIFSTVGVKLLAWDATTGAKKWEFASSKAFTLAAPIYNNGIIYTSNEDKKIYAIDAKTGVKKWEFLTEYISSDDNQAPTYSNGLVYCGGGFKKLYALDAEKGTKKWEFIPIQIDKDVSRT